ncbi:MAG: NAD(P)-dependent oxidoreductase [Chloroflexi bacterium]|nr:NAD(P)-dependent oxidoreductase [Chloroflexota bacterium]
MRILITGGSGDLGRPLSRIAASQHEVLATFFRTSHIGGGQAAQLDIRDGDSVLQLVGVFQPDAIIHTVTANHGPDDVGEVDVLGASHIADAAARYSAYLIALSTDMIFDGTRAPYREDAPPAPLSAYAEAKVAMERHIRERCPASLIVRTSLIYDFDRRNRQVSWMIRRIDAGQPVPLFVDEIRQPIWAQNLAKALVELVEVRPLGVLNVAGGEAISRWNYGRALLQTFGFDPDENTLKAQAAELAPQRPRDCSLVLDKAERLLSTPLLSLAEATTFHQG